MKTSFKYLVLIICFSVTHVSFSQSTSRAVSGIFLTKDDFEAGRLANQASLDNDNFIVEELGRPKLFRNGTKTKYRFGDVYGYYQNGVKYRAYREHLFFDRPSYYKVVDESTLLVYALKSSGNKGHHYTYYYYSLDAGSPIIPINKRTIIKAFAENPDVLNTIKQAIRNKTIVQKDSTGVTELNKLLNSVGDKNL